MCNTLGIMLDPDQNRLSVTEDIRKSIRLVSTVFSEMHQQKQQYGTVNEDLWLEFIPWHSLN